MCGLFIITASSASVQLVNRALIYLRWWQEKEPMDNFRLLTSKTDIPSADDYTPTDAPLQKFDPSTNEWESTPIDIIERLMIMHAINKDRGSNGYLFVVLDDQGVRDHTMVLAERAYERDTDGVHRHVEEYNKVRVPWQEVYLMWSNMDIANMGFEDFCEARPPGAQKHDRWWVYRPVGMEWYQREEIERKDGAIEDLAKVGLA